MKFRILAFLPLLLLVAGAVPARAQVSGAAASYFFEEGTGTTTADSSGNNNTGTLSSGVSWVAGKVGKAVSFNGTSGSITVNDSPSLDFTGSFTLAGWVNPAKVSGTQTVLIKENASGCGYWIQIADNQIDSGFNNGTKCVERVTTSANLIAGNWYHIAVVLDHSGNTYKVYVNGNQVLSASETGAPAPNTQPLIFGMSGCASCGNERFSGAVDEVRLYSRALSASEVLALYTGTPGSGTAAPAITSGGSATFRVGTTGTFTVAASGTPAPVLSESGGLPSGVTFTNTTGVLSGRPAAGTGGIYPITFTAQNGVLPNAVQSFTLTVNQAPAITSANNTTFSVGSPGAFAVTATGVPAPALGESGRLPTGVTFTPSSGVLSGTPAAGTNGSYRITFTAQNGVTPNASQTFTLTVNTPSAVPVITSPGSANGTVGSAFSYQIAATNSPTSFSATGLPAGLSVSTSTGLISGTPTAAGTFSVTIRATNGSGTGSAVLSLTISALPTVTINQASGQSDPTNGSAINFTAVFSTAVTGFTGSGVVVGGTAGATTAFVTGSGTTYNVAVSGMTQSGTVTAFVPAGVASSGGVFNTASTSTDNIVTFDITPPSVTINQAASQTDPASASPVNFTVLFSESVTGFTNAGVTLGGTAGANTAIVTGSGTTYNVAASGMTQSGTIVASVGSGKVTDLVGNPNAASTSTDNSVTYNFPPLTVTINQAASQADPTNSSTINFTLIFSASATGFTNAGVTLGGTAGATTAVVTGSGTTYNVAVSGMTQSGTVTASVSAGAATANGGQNSQSTSTDNSVTYDITPPTVAINQAAAQADPASTSPINFTAVFSEAVTGFTNAGVTLGGTAGATTAVVTGSGSTYNVAVSGMTQSGTVTASIGSGKATDSAGNPNTASTSTDNSVTYSFSALPGPVASYSFEEGTGTTTADSSGNNNNGTLSSGVSWVAGKVGKAVSFNGTSGSITVNDSPSLDFTGSFTLAGWVNPAKVSGTQTVLIKENASGCGYWIQIADNQIDSGFNNGTKCVERVTTSANLIAGNWYHIAVVLDHSGNTYKVYVNGNQVLSASETGAPAPNTQPLIFGMSGCSSCGNERFSGAVDEMKIYNRALAAAEIQLLANPGSSSSDTQPPSAPASLTATSAGTSQINLAWAASNDNVGVTAYLIERCQGAGCSNFAQVASTPGTTYNDSTGLSTGTTYNYRVRATDAAGNPSGYSNIATATTNTQPPSAPGSLVATPASSSQINLTWSASSDSLGISAYLIERCQGTGCANFAQIASSAVTSYNDTTSLLPSTSYSYRVRATDTVGNTGQYSNVASAMTMAGSSSGPITVSPRNAALTFTRSQQFTASASGVVWSVDGVAGGSSSSGTITGAGLYSPPNSVGTHTVTATSSDQSQSGSVTVYITNYLGTFTHHNDNQRTGQNQGETVLTPANVNSSTFGKLFTYQLDGVAYASPLYVANVNIPGQGFHNVVYVATEHDSVYAYDADGLSASFLWKTTFINPAAGVTTVPAGDTGEDDDIAGEIGITGTPVIDSTTGTLYVLAKTKENGSYFQKLHALDIATGTEKFGGPAVIQASVNGVGGGSNGNQIPFDALRENDKAALLLSNGVVYIAWASHGDILPYHGWVLGYSASNLQRVMIANLTPNGNGAGIWQSGGGIATDTAGNLYFVTGNGDFDADSGGIDYGEAYIKLSTSGAVLDYFAPHNVDSLNNFDLDLGSAGLIVLPDQPGAAPRLVGNAGKGGTIYVVNRDNMGHFNAANDNQIVQSVVGAFPNPSNSNIGGNFISPVYFNGTIYFSPVLEPLKAFHFTNGLLSSAPTSVSSETFSYMGAALAISANANNSGILWAIERVASGQNDLAAPGVLHAYDATNLASELYTSKQAGSRDTLDFAAKYTVPLVANGKVFVANVSELVAYGLLP